MVDLTSIAAMMTAAGSVIGLANKANTVEANQKIIELQKRMSEVQKIVADLFQENQDMKEKNRALQDELNSEDLFPFRESVRWKKGVAGSSDDGPFCPICFANTKTLMPLRVLSKAPDVVSFMCPEIHATNPTLGRSIVYRVDERSLKQGRYRLVQ